MASTDSPEVIATVSEPYVDVSCDLGEGPNYNEETGTFHFVDIMEKKAYSFDVKKGPSSLKTVSTQDSVGVLASIEGVTDKQIVAAKYGFAILDEAGNLDYVAKTWDDSKDGEGKRERMRFNDGAIDPKGRFFAGSMTDNALHEPINEGAIFRLDPDRSVHRVYSPVHIPNGMGWSLDQKTMYMTDSPTRTIWAFDYDIEAGTVSNRRAWFTLETDAFPDGFAMDEHGNIWSALYGGYKVIKIQDFGGKGKIVAEVGLPTKAVTCPRFVGTELYITTAADNPETGEERSKQTGGRLFKVDVGVRGAKVGKWKGTV